MAVVATGIYLLTVVFAPNKGILAKAINKRIQRNKIEQEDILRQGIKYHKKEKLTQAMLIDRLGYTSSRLKNLITKLKKEGLLTTNSDEISLSIKGFEKAEELVRAHRLWESYQVDKMGLEEGQIHDEADRLEHWLSEEILDEVDGVLGFPNQDPHGSPIPQKKKKPLNPLLKLRPRDSASISKTQINDFIESELWELGLLPNTTFVVSEIARDYVRIKQNQKSIDIPASLASQINVN